jgi:hypothetical protein
MQLLPPRGVDIQCPPCLSLPDSLHALQSTLHLCFSQRLDLLRFPSSASPPCDAVQAQPVGSGLGRWWVGAGPLFSLFKTRLWSLAFPGHFRNHHGPPPPPLRRGQHVSAPAPPHIIVLKHMYTLTQHICGWSRAAWVSRACTDRSGAGWVDGGWGSRATWPRGRAHAWRYRLEALLCGTAAIGNKACGNK